MFSNQKYGVSGVFRDLGPLVLLQKEHSFALRISIAVQRNDLKIFFELSSNFLDCQYTKMFLGKLWQSWKFLNFSATLALVSYKQECIGRSSRQEVFCDEGALTNFAKLTGKHLCQSLSKIRFWHMCFPVNFAKFLRTPFLTERLRWLLFYRTSHV